MDERRLKEIGTEDKCLSPLKNCCFRLLVCQSSAQGFSGFGKRIFPFFWKESNGIIWSRWKLEDRIGKPVAELVWIRNRGEYFTTAPQLCATIVFEKTVPEMEAEGNGTFPAASRLISRNKTFNNFSPVSTRGEREYKTSKYFISYTYAADLLIPGWRGSTILSKYWTWTGNPFNGYSAGKTWIRV